MMTPAASAHCAPHHRKITERHFWILPVIFCQSLVDNHPHTLGKKTCRVLVKPVITCLTSHWSIIILLFHAYIKCRLIIHNGELYYVWIHRLKIKKGEKLDQELRLVTNPKLKTSLKLSNYSDVKVWLDDVSTPSCFSSCSIDENAGCGNNELSLEPTFFKSESKATAWASALHAYLHFQMRVHSKTQCSFLYPASHTDSVIIQRNNWRGGWTGNHFEEHGSF